MKIHGILTGIIPGIVELVIAALIIATTLFPPLVIFTWAMGEAPLARSRSPSVI